MKSLGPAPRERWRTNLARDKAAELLQRTLEEEGDADHKLSEIAESEVNVEALLRNVDNVQVLTTLPQTFPESISGSGPSQIDHRPARDL